MEYYNRLVIDLYKRCFSDYINGSPVDADAIQEVQRVLNFAIDKAKISNESVEMLEALRKDVGYLKYDLL